MFVDNLAAIDDLLSALHDAAGQGNAVVKLVEAGFAALLVVYQVGGDVVVEVTLAQHLLMGCQGLIVEELLVGGDDGVDLVDLTAGGVLAADDADGTRGVLDQAGIFRTVHDALVVEIVKTVGDDAQIVVVQARDTVAVVLVELPDLLASHLVVEGVVGLVELHQAVALGLHGFIALVDREVEGGAQLIVSPGLALFDLKGTVAASGHQPHDDDDGKENHPQTDEDIAPGNIVFCIETAHFISFF